MLCILMLFKINEDVRQIKISLLRIFKLKKIMVLETQKLPLYYVFKVKKTLLYFFFLTKILQIQPKILGTLQTYIFHKTLIYVLKINIFYLQ